MTPETSQPKVAIVIPVFNVEKYLSECLESILNQTYKNYEIFSVDDGSTDCSGVISDDYAKRYPFIHSIHQNNNGVASARNNALGIIEKDSSFEFTVFIDGDDIVHSTYIEHLVHESQKQRADITLCGFSMKETMPCSTYCVVPPPKIGHLASDEFLKLLFSVPPWDRTNYSGGMIWKAIFRSKSIKGLRFIHDRNATEDEYFFLEAMLASKRIFLLPEILYIYRQRNSSLVHSSHNMLHILKGRTYCSNLSKNMPTNLQKIFDSVFIATGIKAIGGSSIAPSNFPFPFQSYFKYLRDAKELQLINSKQYRQGWLLCKHPLLAQLYFWKKRQSAKFRNYLRMPQSRKKAKARYQ